MSASRYKIQLLMASGLTLILILAVAGLSRADDKRVIQFNRDIRPILTDHCFACHGPDKNKRQANLRLDQPTGLKERNIIVAGHPEKSAIVARTSAVGTPMQMPPASFAKGLNKSQIGLIARWIKEGGEYQPHWSYIPPKRPVVPRVAIDRRIAEPVTNPIDAFILAKLQQKGIARQSPPADRRTLIRRVYLDLIGIPPSPREVEQFVNDKSSNAYEKVVDRLLKSPYYGERMATPWLDLVRYADTVGFHGDQNMNAWAYRDYVIASFNKNKPFDRFTLEQLAGDIIPNATTETRVATCFNRLNCMTREGGAQPKEYLAKYMADRVRTVSMTWLGSTMGCCECHDHKYDPFKTKDFYSLASFFADIKQWGVYQDYDYTPNPDLKGWSNDHPWPPEILVESPYLKNRIAKDHEKVRQIAMETESILERDAQVKAGFDAWRKYAANYAQKHADGWDRVSDVAVVGLDGKPGKDKPYFVAQADGSFLIAKEAPADIQVSIKPNPGWISTFRLELLPNAAYGGSVLREGGGGTISVSASRINGAGGKAQGLGIRHAVANYHEPRYFNVSEILGMQHGWQLSAKHLKDALDSTWILDTPVRVEAGDTIQVAVKRVKVGCVRVSLSPFAPDDPDSLQLPANLAAACGGDEPHNAEALTAYLKGTGWKADAYSQVKTLEADIVTCTGGKTPVMVVESVKPMTMRVLPRGNWQNESGEIVHPSVPAFLPGADKLNSRPLNRIDLANWIVSPENPLTARVFVNRLWKMYFGTGLSASVEDAGAQGEWPVHPELLDWLACEFRDGQKPATRSSHPWDIKHIVKLIVMSSTYRQSSRPRPELKMIDPNNRLLASQNPRRLEAEIVRDNALAISGLINLDMGGPPCHPYQPAKYYENLQFPDREYQPDKDDRQWRRGVYAHWQRTFLLPSFANFDAPSREDCTAFRTVANTPQQALTLLNDPAFVEAARSFAQQVLSQPNRTDAQRINQAYLSALSRYAKPRELESLLAFLKNARSAYQQRPEDGKKLETVGYSPASKSVDANELAAWTSVCRVILNLHETITKY